MVRAGLAVGVLGISLTAIPAMAQAFCAGGLINEDTVHIGRVVLKGDCRIKARHVIVRRNAFVEVPAGGRLEIDADELEIVGAAFFDGAGAPGNNPEQPESAGEWTSSGSPGWNVGPVGKRNLCHKNWEDAGGHADDRGKNGGNGGNGTDGAIVHIRYAKLSGVTGGVSNLRFDVSGGAAGVGAPGGLGRKIICGCHGSEVKRGPSGTHGANGQPGKDGKWVVEIVPAGSLGAKAGATVKTTTP